MTFTESHTYIHTTGHVSSFCHDLYVQNKSQVVRKKEESATCIKRPV